MFNAYIADDGYTLPFYIMPVAGLYPSIRGTFRPTLRRTRTKHIAEAVKMDDEQAEIATIEQVVPRIHSWNVVDKDGRQVPVSKEGLEGIHPALFPELTTLVLGHRPTDIDPEWPDELKAEYRAMLKEERDSLAAREQADAKN